MSLLDTLEGFTGALREAGVPAGTSEVLDATRVLGAIDLLDRRQLRAGLAAALVKRPVHRPTFDLLFDLWWPPAVGDPLELTQRRDDESGDEAGEPGEPDLDALRDELRQLLLTGDDEALRRFARLAVAELGHAGAQPGRQSWFTYRVLRALSPETLIASMLDALLAGEPRGGLAEQLVHTVRALRAMELKKAPSIAESIDWARTLVTLGLDTLDAEAVRTTLGVVLKHASDAARATTELKLS